MVALSITIMQQGTALHRSREGRGAEEGHFPNLDFEMLNFVNDRKKKKISDYLEEKNSKFCFPRVT